MQRQLHSAVSVGMPVVRLLSRPHIEIALAYLAGYVLLDWLSYVHPYATLRHHAVEPADRAQLRA